MHGIVDIYIWHNVKCVDSDQESHYTMENNMNETNHDKIKSAFESYLTENQKFTEKGVKASAARARKALQELGKALKERRKEITAEKESLSTK